MNPTDYRKTIAALEPIANELRAAPEYNAQNAAHKLDSACNYLRTIIEAQAAAAKLAVIPARP